MLGSFSPIHWVIVLGVAAVVFGGRGKLSSIMGDAAKGVRAFRDGLKGDEEQPAAAPTIPAAQIVAPPMTPPPAAAHVEPAREDVQR